MSRHRARRLRPSRRTGRSSAVAAAVGVVALLAAGCGDDEETDVVETELTEDDVVTPDDVVGDDAEQDGGGPDAGAPEDGADEQDEQEEATAEPATIEIVSVADAYEPGDATVPAGTEVTWVNTDDVVHTTTAEDGTWDSGGIDPDGEFSFTPEEPGTYAYVCTIHPSMSGELVVE